METGRAVTISRGDARRMVDRVRGWQDDVARQARAVDLDVIRVGPDSLATDLALAEFVAERRLRKVA